MIVVEASPDKLVVRRGGERVNYKINELPAALAMALADMWLKEGDPVNRVIKGSYYAVADGDRESLRAKAKSWWEEAQLGGVAVTPLMPFLTDNYEQLGQEGQPSN
jgi:hypothetical protein